MEAWASFGKGREICLPQSNTRYINGYRYGGCENSTNFGAKNRKKDDKNWLILPKKCDRILNCKYLQLAKIK